MKIAHIVSTYPPYYGGMGNTVFETASVLIERGYDVEVFTPEYDRPDATEEEMESLENRKDFARRLPARIAYGNAAYMPNLRDELDTFDLVHLHYPFFGTAGLVAGWKRRNPKKPLVITYHMDTRGDGWKGIFFRLYASWYMPSILKSADLLIASSFDYLHASDAQSVYKATKDKWVELPFGVNTERFVPREKPIQLFQHYGLDPELPTIVFVGGMDHAHYFKGVTVLLDAIFLCRKAGILMQAVLVGDGELRESFALRARGMGIVDAVVFAGSVSHEDLPYHYSMGDVCVLPSTTTGEAFGTVLIEAMACGIPVIASDLPGVRSVALNGGDVCAPGNATDLAESLINFCNASDQWEIARKKARNTAEGLYSWDRVGAVLEYEYEKLLARR